MNHLIENDKGEYPFKKLDISYKKYIAKIYPEQYDKVFNDKKFQKI